MPPGRVRAVRVVKGRFVGPTQTKMGGKLRKFWRVYVMSTLKTRLRGRIYKLLREHSRAGHIFRPRVIARSPGARALRKSRGGAGLRCAGGVSRREEGR